MSLEIQLDPEPMSGQMVVCGFEGKSLSTETLRALSSGRLSGVILFAKNLGTPEEVRDLTDAVRSSSSLPPFIAIDQEGGRVTRTSEPFTAWPSMAALGGKDTRLAGEVARAMAAELLAVGINTNLAPVLDVNSNPDSPVIGDRSLGPDAQKVAHLGRAMIEGFMEAGILCCAKHFPGHGDASVDSHLDLPAVDADRATLDRRELLPFVEAVAARVPMIMTAHLKTTALDRYYPATISKQIIRELLREEMGFDGLVITDDLEMGALAKYMPIADSAYSAVRAGADLLLVCSGPGPAEEARKVIVEGIRQGIIDIGEATLSVRRIIRAKERYLEKGPPPRSGIAEMVGCGKHRELAASMA